MTSSGNQGQRGRSESGLEGISESPSGCSLPMNFSQHASAEVASRIGKLMIRDPNRSGQLGTMSFGSLVSIHDRTETTERELTSFQRTVDHPPTFTSLFFATGSMSWISQSLCRLAAPTRQLSGCMWLGDLLICNWEVAVEHRSD